MKKIIVSLVGFLSATAMVNAQDLYVDNASYMFVKDEVVYVKNDIRLENPANAIGTGSHIYLRGDAQLLQDNDVKNSDDGHLSVYQRQVSDIYQYSYWCSPVGQGVNGTAKANVDFTPANNLNHPNSNAAGLTESSIYPVNPSLWDSNATTIAGRWIWQVMNANSYNDWVFVGSNSSSVPAGAGYTQKGTNVAPNIDVIDFRGRPNTGTLTFTASPSGAGALQASYDGLAGNQVQMLVGNPYPSAMDLKLLFVDPTGTTPRNTGFLQEIWFWEDTNTSHYLNQYEGGYAKWAPGTLSNLNDDGTYTVAPFTGFVVGNNAGAQGTITGSSSTVYTNHNRRFAAIGQGFVMVTPNTGATGTGANQTLTIDNSMRVFMTQDNAAGGNGAIFNKTANTTAAPRAMSHNGIDYQAILDNPTIIPEIRVYTTVNDTYNRENVIAFRPGTDLSYSDQGTDATLGVKLASDAYLIASGKDLSIKSIEYDADARIPFGLEVGADNDVFKVHVGNLRATPAGMEMFVYDNETDTYTDIINDTFSTTLDKGTYNDRFEITFKDSSAADQALGIEEDAIANSFTVFQNNNAGSLMIKNPENYNVKAATMFDVTGKIIFNKANLGAKAEYSFPTNTLSTGTYLVKVITKNDVEITKKVMVHNN